MEYSIFQDFQYFACLYIFFLVSRFFRIFHIPKNSRFFMLQVFLEYDIIYIPHKKLNFAWKINFLIIPVIFHIPKISIFPLLKVFLEYSWNIPYSKYFNISLLKVYFGIFHFWDFHIPWNIRWEYSAFKMSLFYGGVEFNQGYLEPYLGKL